jgi:hypothetical protein
VVRKRLGCKRRFGCRSICFRSGGSEYANDQIANRPMALYIFVQSAKKTAKLCCRIEKLCQPCRHVTVNSKEGFFPEANHGIRSGLCAVHDVALSVARFISFDQPRNRCFFSALVLGCPDRSGHYNVSGHQTIDPSSHQLHFIRPSRHHTRHIHQFANLSNPSSASNPSARQLIISSNPSS